MTSVRGKRAVENIDDVYDRNDPPICERNRNAPKPTIQRSSSVRVEKRKPELRWRPRSIRIRRNRQVIDQSGLKVFLLLTQLAAAIEGAQLLSERPDGRPGSGQPHAPRVHPGVSQWTNGTDHEIEARFPPWKQLAAVAKWPWNSHRVPVPPLCRMQKESQRES